MNDFDHAEISASALFPGWLPSIGGLLAAGVVAALVCRLPLTRSLSLGDLVGLALTRLLAVSLAGALAAATLCSVRPGTSRREMHRLVQRTSLDALWLAPLALFLRENSPWSIPLAAALVVSVTKTLRILQIHSAPDQVERALDFPSHRSAFAISETWPWLQGQLSSSGAALCAQTAALAGIAGYPFTASALVALSFAVWTRSFTRNSVPGLRQATPRTLLLMALTFVFVAGALMGYLRNTSMAAGFGIPSHSRHGASHGRRRGQPGNDDASVGGEQRGKYDGREAFADSSTSTRDANSGIILWPKRQTYTKLVAPAPAMGDGLLKSNRHADPLVIPFNGVYWFFKAPDLDPPNTSRQAQGSPELLEIHSTDRRPLSMEAHENLGTLIDLDCCGRMQIVIRNADAYSETVSLELILINSSLPGKPSQSLGTTMVRSTRPWKLFEEQKTASETLNFVVPANPAILRFDEVKIVFRLDPFRADDGAKVAIDRFVLIPRGL
jgi:hypothetical protein